MRAATQGFLILVGILLVFGLCGGSALTRVFTNRITYGEEIGMCQPTGVMLSRDAKCAQEVNVPNSVANYNNGLGRVANAQATAIVETSENFARTQYTGGLTIGMCFGIILGPLGVLLVLAALLKRPV